jgi:hypothetical protein
MEEMVVEVMVLLMVAKLETKVVGILVVDLVVM